MVIGERAAAIQLGTAERTVGYYVNSPTYLTGPLGGTCHFGYTEEGEPFELDRALRAMETLLGQTLDLPQGSVVLDGGCGFGRVATTLALSPFDLDVIGIDLIPERLMEAQRYTRSHDAGNVNLLNGNYCVLPLREASVSGVFTMETLVHADPLEAALGEFWRILKPGGRLVLFEYSVPERTSLDPIRRRITDNMVNRTGMASIGRFTHDSFPTILQQANFENITVRDISRNVWPTWRWLFWTAIRENWSDILQGRFMDHTNLAGSLMIYPYRKEIGYKVVTATKPG